MAIMSATAASAATTAQSTDRTKLNATFDQFLKMLTTQLKYQDPMSPLESTEFTQQLVSFTQVEQMIAQNQKLDTLIGQQKTGRLQGALGYIGMTVEAEGAYFNFDGQPAKLSYTLPTAAAQLRVDVLDEAGRVVTSQAAEGDAGRHEIDWAGKTADGQPLPAGTYMVRVTAIDAAGEPVAATTTVTGRVTGVETADDRVQLLLGSIPVAEDKILSARTA